MNFSPFFRQRNTVIRELMDDPDCDATQLRRTYRWFGAVNNVVAQWPRLFRRYLLPEMHRAASPTAGMSASGEMPPHSTTFTLLDIGCGLLDNGRQLQALAVRHGFRLIVTGIDPSPVAAAMLHERALPADAHFEAAYLHELAERGERFDFVISNHLLHHLSDAEVCALLADVATVTRRVAVMNDLRRAVVPWMVFAGLMWPMRWGTFLHTDGLRSIRRSFRADELRALVATLPGGANGTVNGTAKATATGTLPGGGWQSLPLFPYRNAVVYRGTADEKSL